ncbi:MAG: chromosome replication initiation protein, partial [Planctomycetes bacterium]|nr:chromosome replication initiation protein [Planctomycetota bacterium]
EAPDLKTRQQIVRRKAARLEAELTADALDYVANRFHNNVRELEGALNCLSAHYLILKRPIGVAEARRLLSDLERDCVRLIRLADIEQAVCEMFGVQPDDLRSGKRQRSVSQPRMLAMFLARKHTQAAYREIGQYFGGRNHSTVVSAEKRVREWLSQDATIEVASQTWPLADLVATLEERLIAG